MFCKHENILIFVSFSTSISYFVKNVTGWFYNGFVMLMYGSNDCCISIMLMDPFLVFRKQLPTKQIQFMGYGAVVPDGYGAAYNPQPDFIIFCLSSFCTCAETSTLRFSQSLQRSLDLMKKVLE